jgi:hypothetical protein
MCHFSQAQTISLIGNGMYDLIYLSGSPNVQSQTHLAVPSRLKVVALAALKSVRKVGQVQEPVFLNIEGNPLRSARDGFKPAVEKAG